MAEYMLYVDKKQREFVKTLEEAENLAAPYIAQHKKIKIEWYGTLGAMLILIYDYQIGDWF
jgi:hypothetical protein